MIKSFLIISLLVILQGYCKSQTLDSANKTPSTTPENQNVKEIIVICKTHFDLGFTHRVNEIVSYYRTSMIDKALKMMDASKDMPFEQQFKWTAPGWVMSKIMEDWDGQTPERRAKLDEAFRSGKFLTHAMPFTTESDACEPEELVRGLGFAANLSRKYNLPLPIAAKVTDVPSHTGALATILAQAGVKFIHIGCNWPSGYVKTPGLFWWIGPDGSRILTLYSPIYGTCYGLYPKVWTSPSDPITGENLLPAKDWPFKVWPAILVTPDNSGPPKTEQVRDMFSEVTKKMPGVKVHMGTMDDFVKAILAENPQLPVIKNEMPDTWIHGVMCDPGGIRLSREVHPLIASSEVLNTQLRIWGSGISSNAPSVAQVYEKMLLYGEHTWGMSQKSEKYSVEFHKIPSSEFKNLEASWEDKTDYIRDAMKITQDLADSNLVVLSKEIKYKKPGVVVYNPLPWKRSGIVQMKGIPVLVEDVPPCGYKTIPWKSNTQSNTDDSFGKVIENEFYKITLDAQHGAIVSLIDKRTGREWVDQSIRTGLGQYLNERFTYEQTLKYAFDYQQGRAINAFGTNGDWPHPGMHKPGMITEKKAPYRAAFSQNGKLKITRTVLSQTAMLDMPADIDNHMPASKLQVTLSNKQPFVDIEITIVNKAKDNWPEADWLCLPFKVTNPVFHVFRPLGVMNPATDIQEGANKNLYSVSHGVSITDKDGSGIFVSPLDHPLVSLDTMGCWKFWKDFVPKKPIIYLNLYNNQWNTNFRYWYAGTWSSRVRISTFGPGTESEMGILALEARNPLQSMVTKGGEGKLPSEQPGIMVSRKGVVVTAFGSDPNGNNGTLLRIWEMIGNSGELSVILPQRMKISQAVPVNLRGEKSGTPLKITNGKLTFKLNAYAPASFVLK